MQAIPQLFSQNLDVRFLEHSEVIAGHYPDIKAASRQVSPTVVGVMRREQRLHARPEQGEPAPIGSRLIFPKGPVLRPSNLAVLL